MEVSRSEFATMWGPGYIGLTIATFLYGVGLCQFVFYLQAFRSDRLSTKLQVCIVIVLDTFHFVAVVATFYTLLIRCRMTMCIYYVPWVTTLSVALVYCTTFMVQVFYAHRLWIISGQNAVIMLAVLTSTTLQLVFGLGIVFEIVQAPTIALAFSIKYVPLAALASAVCDTVITASMLYYLRPASIRRGNIVKKLLIVSVEMGLFTLTIVVAMAVLYYTQHTARGEYLSAVPGVILSKSYVNSMLAVLNARKDIRDEQQNAREYSIELPTIHTLH